MPAGTVKHWSPDQRVGLLDGHDGCEYAVGLSDVIAAPLGRDGVPVLPEGALVAFGLEKDDTALKAVRVRVIEKEFQSHWMGILDSTGGWATVTEPTNTDLLHEGLRRLVDGASVQEKHLSSEAVLDVAPHRAAFDGAVFVEDATFSNVTFPADVSFSGVIFKREARFNGAKFGGNARFENTTFSGTATFGGAEFGGGCWFSGATFVGDSVFNGGTVRGGTVFDGATFGGSALFMRRRFGGPASFELEASFQGPARFDEARWQQGVSFSGTRFAGETRFFAANFAGNCSFRGAFFGKDCNYASASFACEELVLDDVAFPDRLAITGTAHHLSCRGARFLNGVSIRLDGATVDLTGAEFAGPSALSGRHLRVLSMRDAYVRDLTLAGADLSRCRFVGAQSLDELAVGDAGFASSPRGWRWSPRDVIFEETSWRHWGKETEPLLGVEARFGSDPVPEPRQIAIVYRDLRKGREDSKDEPGATGFYYGEMEMRRHATRVADGGLADTLTFWAERSVLWAYWLVSGYGLRAFRAFTSLLLLIVVCGVLLYWFGITPQPSFTRALLFSAQSSSSLLRPLQPSTFAPTVGGEIVDMALRLLGPLFIGLFVLSLRGRVKR